MLLRGQAFLQHDRHAVVLIILSFRYACRVFSIAIRGKFVARLSPEVRPFVMRCSDDVLQDRVYVPSLLTFECKLCVVNRRAVPVHTASCCFTYHYSCVLLVTVSV